MILAVLFKVPVVFIVENNQYAMSFPADKWTSSEQIAARGDLYGMPGVATDGNDLNAVRRVVTQAVKHARDGKGPSLVVNDTYRWRGHSKSDRNRYRTQEEIDEWKEKDPILQFRSYCFKKKLLTEEQADEIKEQGYADIESARVFAEASPEPDVSTLMEGVYAP
jgi:pyruvate dehydrogenase E1 component alpha subunit